MKSFSFRARFLRRLAMAALPAVFLLTATATAVYAQEDPQPAEKYGAETVNILLVGIDADGNTGTRSDVMIPGYGKDRINAAYRFGGVKLLKQTIRDNFGVPIHGSILVDFACFEKIVDQLGGVRLELTAAEAAYINRHVKGSGLTQGSQLLNGKQALTYTRNRQDRDGDFSRTERQRKLLKVMIETYKTKKMSQMLRIMKEIEPMVTMDMSKTELAGYAITLFPMLSSAHVRTQAIPVKGGYRDAKINGKAVLVPDLDKCRKALDCARE